MTDSWVDLLGREDVVLAAERESLAAVTTWTLGKPCASCSLRGWLHWGDTPHLVESDTQEANNMTAVPAFGTRAHLLSVMDPWEDPESMVIALEEAGYAIVPVVQVTCEECGSRVEDPFTHRQWHFSWRKRMTELLDRKSGR